VFGAGGGTSSYLEVEDTDLIILWGSNARETHPIFFHHVLKGIHHGARLIVVDPRRTPSAEWADAWLGLNVGTDIALANAVGREIVHAGLANQEFIRRATSDFESFLAAVEPWTLERAEMETGVPADVIRELAHAYARADRAILCWTLGITEHHNAVDNVLALINLALLTGHVGRYGSGLNPLRGQNNVQGGGDMGAIPNRLPGFQDLEDDEARGRFEQAWGCRIPSAYGRHVSAQLEAIGRGEQRGLYVIGENPLQSEADLHHTEQVLRSLDCLIVQDIFLTRTAELADVVLPSTAGWCEAEGTVTNSERRVQRVRKALEPPEGARDDMEIVGELARRLGHEWGHPTAEEVWAECRSLAPQMFGGMTYPRLEGLRGIRWPCPTEDDPGSQFLHGRLWEEPLQGPRAPFHATVHEPPVDELSEEFPIRLTTGRRLESFNTGVQSGGYHSPLRERGEAAVHVAPEDAARLGLADGARALATSRRGSIEVPVAVDGGLRPGLAFLSLHFPDEVATNILTIDATDPKSGTAEFKASAIRLEPLAVLTGAGE
jgi:formate dehydrogenase major subunit